MKKLVIPLLLAVVTGQVCSAEKYINGTVTNITSVSSGLLIQTNGGEKPSGCQSASPWMLIPEENETMVSVALSSYLTGNKAAVVYVDITASGYCKVIQYDPVG